jgi:hypothetical protein
LPALTVTPGEVAAKSLHAAESEALQRACEQVVLRTHSFQAPGFYDHTGYERRYAIEDLPKGSTDMVYVKRLRAASGADAA